MIRNRIRVVKRHPEGDWWAALFVRIIWFWQNRSEHATELLPSAMNPSWRGIAIGNNQGAGCWLPPEILERRRAQLRVARRLLDRSVA
jgi:hypothetical protein